MMKRVQKYLLLRLGASAGPFDNNILLGFIVGCKGECDTGKGGALVVRNKSQQMAASRLDRRI